MRRLQALLARGLTTTAPLWPEIRTAYALVHQAAHLLANHEEVDACERVRRAGFRIRYEPAAVLDHLQASDGGCRVDERRDGTRSVTWHRNEVLFLIRNRRWWEWPLVGAGQLHWYALNRAAVREGTAWPRLKRLATGAEQGQADDEPDCARDGEHAVAKERERDDWLRGV